MSSNDPFSYVIDKVNIYIHGQTEVLNVAGSLLELELMEDIDNLHITGSLSFLDTNNVFENVDFDGTEYIQISAMLPDSPSDRWSSWFHVVRVMKTSKGNDTAEAITVELIDRDSYINNLINVNKSYAGKITLMMDNILRDNFKAQKRMMFSTQDIQEPILYIPPNLTPYQTLKVLRSRCTGPTGTPFYLFAVLNDNRLRFFDLFDMLNLPAINQGSPYTFNQRATDTGDVQDTSYHITTLDIRNTEDMMTLIRKGMVGAEYNYVNTTGGYVDIVKYDAQKVIDNIWKYSTQKTLAPVVNVNAQASGTYLTDYKSTVNTFMTSSNVYNDFAGLDEDLTTAFHRPRAISAAVKEYMGKSSISIRVPGRNFFPSQKNMTIGNTIEIDILSNNDLRKGMSARELKDQKRSGKYVILSSRHHFVDNRYSVDLTLGKLGNRSGTTTAGRYGGGFGQVDRSLAQAAGLID